MQVCRGAFAVDEGRGTGSSAAGKASSGSGCVRLRALPLRAACAKLGPTASTRALRGRRGVPGALGLDPVRLAVERAPRSGGSIVLTPKTRSVHRYP
ncbi:hypothetical protein [Sorangium sp. So ce381]|uniref:hypothetical protein n=1 Tax=Sorangium sp. So ce381 TaxID=3133307 RepID=UPI003F5B7A2D